MLLATYPVHWAVGCQVCLRHKQIRCYQHRNSQQRRRPQLSAQHSNNHQGLARPSLVHRHMSQQGQQVGRRRLRLRLVQTRLVMEVCRHLGAQQHRKLRLQARHLFLTCLATSVRCVASRDHMLAHTGHQIQCHHHLKQRLIRPRRSWHRRTMAQDFRAHRQHRRTLAFIHRFFRAAAWITVISIARHRCRQSGMECVKGVSLDPQVCAALVLRWRMVPLIAPCHGRRHRPL